MNWLIDVSPLARQAYLDLDAPSQEELREHAALIAERPMELLTHSVRVPGSLEYEFRSRTADGLLVVLIFLFSSPSDNRITLLTILRFAQPSDPPDE